MVDKSCRIKVALPVAIITSLSQGFNLAMDKPMQGCVWMWFVEEGRKGKCGEKKPTMRYKLNFPHIGLVRISAKKMLTTI